MKFRKSQDLQTLNVSHNPNVKKKVFLNNGEIPHVINFATATFPPKQKAPAHKHNDMNEVFFVVAGNGEIEIDNSITLLHPGVCVIVEANEVHELRNTGDDNLVVTYFAVSI